MKKIIFILTAILFVTANSFAQKKAEKNKFLEGKKFNVQFYEMKPTGRGKAVSSLFIIKNGRIEADLMYEKLGIPDVPYRVTLDSTYTEDEVEMRMISFEADYSEEKNQYKWEVTVTNYDIEGTFVQERSGVERKRYEFSGSEKAKKK